MRDVATPSKIEAWQRASERYNREATANGAHYSMLATPYVNGQSGGTCEMATTEPPITRSILREELSDLRSEIREHYATKADLANFELRLMRLFGIVSAIAGFAFAIGKQLIESLGIG